MHQRAAPLDVELAREVLKTSLEAWKKGDSPDTLKNGSPSIIAQDPDWVTGGGSSPTRSTATTSPSPRICSFRSIDTQVEKRKTGHEERYLRDWHQPSSHGFPLVALALTGYPML